MEIVMTCPICGDTHSVKVDADAYFSWVDGELAQNAFPNLSPTEREALISNLCPACQEEVFG